MFVVKALYVGCYSGYTYEPYKNSEKLNKSLAVRAGKRKTGRPDVDPPIAGATERKMQPLTCGGFGLQGGQQAESRGQITAPLNPSSFILSLLPRGSMPGRCVRLSQVSLITF